jgi:hypothetical protein
MSAVFFGGVLSERCGQMMAAPEGEVPKLPATTMAFIDVAYIFKNHKAFNDQMAALGQKAQAIQQQHAATEAQLNLLKARAEQTTDKAEKQKLEADLARQFADHQVFIRTNQRDVTDQEARIYYETFVLLQEETKKYCRARGIHVAMRTTRDAIKPDDRNSVLQGLNRAVVFSDAPDISDDMLKALNAAAEARAAKAKQEETKSR